MLFLLAGWGLAALGILGIFLPVLPTTPFLLAAAACFSVSGPKSLHILEKSPLFGPYLSAWRTKKGVYLRDKLRAILFLWICLAASVVITRMLWLACLLIIVGVAVSVHLIRMKTRKDD